MKWKIKILLMKMKKDFIRKYRSNFFWRNWKKLDALAYEITTKKTTRTELLELFANLKKQHIKAIKDEIKHLQILEYTNQQIALKMDDIVLNYKNSLSSADTSSNILLNKN